MSTALTKDYYTLLERTLNDNFLPQLPPLLDATKSTDEQYRKNLSRAFGAFALHRICDIDPTSAAKSVVDDFDDYGIDAIYYDPKTETLYLIQSKLKASEQFSQEEALAFCQGIRKLIDQDFAGFNQNIQNRITEIEDALENCSHIQLVVAHTGAGITKHAEIAIKELIDEDHGEERFCEKPINYDAAMVLRDIRAAKAYERVDSDIWLQKSACVMEPRVTYFGLIHLDELVKLHQKHGKALYDKNIRTFLGHKTDVNVSISQTLSTNPKEFLYLNNGIAVLCQEIEPKGTNRSKKGKKKFKVKGFSVINGAQTIASAAHLVENNNADIADAKVFINLIKASSDGAFGKSVTYARNHQNPVTLLHFVALDDEQERLRRELAYLGIHYAYKAEASDNKSDPMRIGVDEAAQALALFHPDPRFVVWLKKEPSRLLDMKSSQYKELFSPSLTALALVNAVRFLRYVQTRMTNETNAASGQERLTYKHGNHAIGWVLAKRVKDERQSAKLLDEVKIKSVVGPAFDQLRQTVWTETEKSLIIKGPLAFFKNQTDVLPLMETVMIQFYGLSADPVVEHKRRQQIAGQPYAKEVFDYVISKAPQIGSLT